MSRSLTALLLSAFFALAPTYAHGADGGAIKGKVNYQGEPLGGAMVYLYSNNEEGFNGKADFEAGPTGEDGVFEAAVDGGSYYIVARKTSGGPGGPLSAGDYFSYYGGNPVKVEAGSTINIGINCSPIMDAGEKRVAGGTGIRGRVYADGEPLSRARVTLYQDGETIFRGIGYASAITNADGNFAFNLEPGAYFVVARKRMGSERMGPLAEGDLFAFAHENPVGVEDGNFTVITMNAVTKLVKVKEGGQAVTLGGTVKAGETLIKGVVKDATGRPVKGVKVSAYLDSMMIYKPDFISNETGEDGAYTITLSGGGEYFIMARDTIGGPAEKGDLLGRYDGNEDHSVVLETGEKKDGIDIVVETVQ